MGSAPGDHAAGVGLRRGTRSAVAAGYFPPAAGGFHNGEGQRKEPEESQDPGQQSSGGDRGPGKATRKSRGGSSALRRGREQRGSSASGDESPRGLSTGAEGMVVDRSEGELSLSDEEVPRGCPAAMETGLSAGGTLLRQPGKSVFSSLSIGWVDGLVAGSGNGSVSQFTLQRAVPPIPPLLAASVHDHGGPGFAGVSGGVKGFREKVRAGAEWVRVAVNGMGGSPGVGGWQDWGIQLQGWHPRLPQQWR